MKNLTKRQEEILNLIKSHILELGFPPTRADISNKLGFKSPNAAEQHLRAIEKKGFIKILSGASRGIVLNDLSDHEIPVIGLVAAGGPILAQENIEKTVPRSNNLLNEKIDFYDKKKLVPFGEYIPFRKILSFSKLTSGTGDFNEGTNPSFMKLSFGDSFITFEPSICYEAVFQTFGFNSTNLFINITNDAWFGKTTGPRQHLAAQIFRSVEKGSPLIRSSNSGISVITNSNGKILKKINLNEAGFIEDQILLNNKETFFEKYKSNSLLVLLLFLIMIFYLIDLIFSSKRKQSSFN